MEWVALMFMWRHLKISIKLQLFNVFKGYINNVTIYWQDVYLEVSDKRIYKISNSWMHKPKFSIVDFGSLKC